MQGERGIFSKAQWTCWSLCTGQISLCLSDKSIYDMDIFLPCSWSLCYQGFWKAFSRVEILTIRAVTCFLPMRRGQSRSSVAKSRIDDRTTVWKLWVRRTCFQHTRSCSTWIFQRTPFISGLVSLAENLILQSLSFNGNKNNGTTHPWWVSKMERVTDVPAKGKAVEMGYASGWLNSVVLLIWEKYSMMEDMLHKFTNPVKPVMNTSTRMFGTAKAWNLLPVHWDL